MTDDESAIGERGARIDDLETAVRDLRHAVSELGRRLAMDLPQVLARHRDAIVAALAPVPVPSSEPMATGTAVPSDAVSRPDIADPPPPDPERPPEYEDSEPEATARARRGLRRRRGTVY